MSRSSPKLKDLASQVIQNNKIHPDISVVRRNAFVDPEIDKNLTFAKKIKNKTGISGFAQCCIVVFIALLLINIFLIYHGEFGDDPNVNGITPATNETPRIVPKTGERVKIAIGNGLYFTTTQFTTIGYGDMGPKTVLGKGITCIAHFMVLFISLKLMEEFGFKTKANEEQAENHRKLQENQGILAVELLQHNKKENERISQIESHQSEIETARSQRGY